jgi:hypothetical protein
VVLVLADFREEGGLFFVGCLACTTRRGSFGPKSLPMARNKRVRSFSGPNQRRCHMIDDHRLILRLSVPQERAACNRGHTRASAGHEEQAAIAGASYGGPLSRLAHVYVCVYGCLAHNAGAFRSAAPDLHVPNRMAEPMSPRLPTLAQAMKETIKRRMSITGVQSSMCMSLGSSPATGGPYLHANRTAVAGPNPHFTEPHLCPAARQTSQTTIDSDIMNGLRAPVPIDEREPTETVVVLGACLG